VDYDDYDDIEDINNDDEQYFDNKDDKIEDQLEQYEAIEDQLEQIDSEEIDSIIQDARQNVKPNVLEQNDNSND
jgi:hypothetical protein